MARALMPRQPYSVAVPSTGGRLHPLVPEEEGLGEKVEPSLAKEGRGDSKKSSFERRQVQSDTAMRNQI